EMREEEAGKAPGLIGAAGPVLRPEADEAWRIERDGDGFHVRGRRVERMAAMTNPESFEAMERLERNLKKLGVLQALRDAGVEVGDDVYIGKVKLEWGDEM
ncbi:MAG TPA: Obg family GTPase CgtA, partial [Ktedonobacterales bacterium]